MVHFTLSRPASPLYLVCLYLISLIHSVVCHPCRMLVSLTYIQHTAPGNEREPRAEYRRENGSTVEDIKAVIGMVVRGWGGSGDEELLMRSRSGRLWVIWAFEFHRRMGATACVSQTHTGSMAGARILERPSPSRLVCRWARNDARPFRGCSGGGMGGAGKMRNIS